MAIERHGLKRLQGTITYNDESGVMSYIPLGKFLPAFSVSLADISTISEQRVGLAKERVKIHGMGATLVDITLNMGMAQTLREWIGTRRIQP